MTFNRAGHPDPLIYYLHSSVLAHAQALASAGRPAPDGLAPHLDPQMREAIAAASASEIGLASLSRLNAMMRGITRWRNAPPSRRDIGGSTLLNLKGARIIDCAPERSGRPVLIIPSLINRAYVLTLAEGPSFVDHLQRRGLKPYLVDWGTPAPGTNPARMEHYVTDILEPGLAHLAQQHQAPIGLLGYCMGGTLALAVAARQAQSVAALALLGTPWDFAPLSGVAAALREHMRQSGNAALRRQIEALGAAFGVVPAGVFQQLFACLAPMQVIQKFTAFEALAADDAAFMRFVAVEDWLADGVPVAAPVAQTLLVDWYLENATARGAWKVGGVPILPEEIRTRSLILVGARDHIVPPALSAPLARQIEGAAFRQVDTGHVGMIVGRRAHAHVADPICAFLMK